MSRLFVLCSVLVGASVGTAGIVDTEDIGARGDANHDAVVNVSDAVAEVAESTKLAEEAAEFDWKTTERVAFESMLRVTEDAAKAFVIVRTLAPTSVTADTVYVNLYHRLFLPAIAI